MVARFHYDDAVYKQLLTDKLPDDSRNSVTTHIENCETCQSRLEGISFAASDVQEVRDFLDADFHCDRASGIADSTRFVLNGNPLGSDSNTLVAGLAGSERLGFLQPTDHPGSHGKFGRYEIMQLLGRGGMGIVMRGYDPALARESAIKVLSPELATNASARKRFAREAKSAAAVVHEHVIPIQTVNEEAGLPYLVMPLVNGKSLQERVSGDCGALELVEVLRIGMQAAAGLAAAHKQGLVHRDVKPANIMLENGVERVLIADFGLARAADDANMTRSQVIAGTPQYMSPEQARGNEIDSRSDLFSLGSVLYFMCCGHSPFRATTTMGVLNRIGNDNPKSIRKQNPAIPEWLESIIFRLLEKDPNKRIQSADEVASLLGQWLAHVEQPDEFAAPSRTTVSAGRSGWPPVAKWLFAFGAMAFFLAAISVIVLETNKGTITIESARKDVVIHIKQGKSTVRELKVKKGKTSTRISAGEYVIEVKGELDDYKIENGTVTLNRRGKWIAKIIEKIDPRKTKAEQQPAAQINKGVSLLQQGSLEDAEELFKKLLETESGGKRAEVALTQLSLLERKRDNLVKSVEYQNELIERFPNSSDIASVKYLRGLNLMHLGEFDAAEQAFTQTLLDHAGSQHAGFSEKGLKWIEKKRFRNDPDAMVVDRTISDLSIDELAILAGHRFSQRNFDEASELFEKILGLEPDGKHTSTALIQLSSAKAAQGDLESAIDLLNEWLARFPGSSGKSMNMYYLGLYHSRLGRPGKAKEYFDQVIEEYPGSMYFRHASKMLDQMDQFPGFDND